MSSRNIINVYSCTKPLQWFNVENLFEFTKGDKNVLLVIAFFPNVTGFIEKVRETFPHWDDIHVLRNRLEVALYLLKIKPECLYTDSDYGFKGYLQTLFFKGDVYIYEEGIGTYFFNAKSLGVSTFKINLFKLIGAGKFLGNHYKTKGIYLYNTVFYKNLYPDYKRPVLSFEFNFVQSLTRKVKEITYIFNLEDAALLGIENKRILIYATNHFVNKEIVRYMDKEAHNFDKVFIKPHPHLVKNASSKLTDLKYELILNNVMLEFLILKLTSTNKVTILHESSTGCIYFSDSNNLTLINFGGPIYPFYKLFQKALV